MIGYHAGVGSDDAIATGLLALRMLTQADIDAMFWDAPEPDDEDD